MRASRRPWRAPTSNVALNLLLFRRLALPCTSISDCDSSGPISGPCAGKNTQQSGAEARDGSSSDGRRRYSYTRRWYSKEEMMNRVASILRGRGWEWSYPRELKIELDAPRVSMIMNELFDATSDAALAFFFFRWSRRHNGSAHETLAVCTMIHISAMGNMNHIAMKLLRDLLRCRRGNALDSLFHLLKESSRDRAAMETVCSMLLNSCLEEDMVDAALRLLDAMKSLGSYPSTGVCITLIKKLMNSGRLEQTLSIFAEALRHGRDLSNQSITLLIHHCSIRGNLADALGLFAEMHDKYGCRPDLVSYTVVIDSLCKTGYLKEAAILLLKLVREGFSPDSVLISSLVDGYCKAGRLTDAVSILRALDFSPDEFICNSFLHRLCDEGKTRDAAELLDEMSEWGAYPDRFNWTTLFSGYCRANQVNEAMKIFGGMLKRGIEPDLPTYSVLLRCYSKRGEMRAAEAVISIAGRGGMSPDLAAFNALINGYAMRGEMQQALEALDAMTARGVHPDLATFNALIHGFVRGGRLPEARRLAAELPAGGHSPDRFTFTILMTGFIKAGDLREASELWAEFRKTGERPDPVSCSTILSGLCKMGRVRKAHALFTEMVEDGLAADVAVFNSLVCGFCRQGDVREGIRLVHVMAESDVIPSRITYRALVRGLKMNGVEDAEEVAAAGMRRILEKNNIFVDPRVYISSC